MKGRIIDADSRYVFDSGHASLAAGPRLMLPAPVVAVVWSAVLLLLLLRCCHAQRSTCLLEVIKANLNRLADSLVRASSGQQRHHRAVLPPPPPPPANRIADSVDGNSISGTDDECAFALMPLHTPTRSFPNLSLVSHLGHAIAAYPPTRIRRRRLHIHRAKRQFPR